MTTDNRTYSLDPADWLLNNATATDGKLPEPKPVELAPMLPNSGRWAKVDYEEWRKSLVKFRLSEWRGFR